MIWALLAAYLTKRPPWIQAVVFGLCVGLFVSAAAHANTREPVLSRVVIQVLTVAAVVGGLFYLGLRRRQPQRGDIPTWVHVLYAVAWVLALGAAVLALFGAGGFTVAVLAIVPIVLLAPPAVLGVRVLLGRPLPSGGPEPSDSPDPAPVVDRDGQPTG
jgi:hypothetical protein